MGEALKLSSRMAFVGVQSRQRYYHSSVNFIPSAKPKDLFLACQQVSLLKHSKKYSLPVDGSVQFKNLNG
jgi:hypothetical protein